MMKPTVDRYYIWIGNDSVTVYGIFWQRLGDSVSGVWRWENGQWAEAREFFLRVAEDPDFVEISEQDAMACCAASTP